MQEKSIKAKSTPERKSDEKESCSTGFSACGGSRKRHSTIPSQCDPRGAFLSYRNEVFYTIKNRMQVGENSGLPLCANKNTENRIKSGMEKEEREWI